MKKSKYPNYIADSYPSIPLMEGKNVWGTVYFTEKFIPITNDIIDGIYNIYLVSNYGKVYNTYIGEYVKVYKWGSNLNSDQKYNYVSLLTIHGFKTVAVHRLVLACFYPELGSINQKLDVNHKNGDKDYNYISYNDPNRGNLEWCTRSENINHAYGAGLHHVGEDNVHSKITEETAQKIITLLSMNKYTSKEIVDLVRNGATTHIVDDIRKKQCWAHLTKDCNFHQRINRIFTEDDIHHFCQYFQTHIKTSSVNNLCREALSFYGFEPSYNNVETLRKVYSKKYYHHIVSQYNW